jgi:hypothetical protein
VVTGPYRGRQHCFVCDLESEPGVLVFLRNRDAATGRLLQKLKAAAARYQAQKLFVWVVFLGEAGTAAELQEENAVFAWSRRIGVEAVTTCVLGDPNGPPGYALPRQAQATVLMFRRRKVLFHHEYGAGEWTTAAAEAALKELPLLLKASAGDTAPAQPKPKVQPPPRPTSGEGE